MSKLWVFNEVCSEGWKDSKEAVPEVFSTFEKAVERGYIRYAKVWQEMADEDELEEWVYEEGLESKEDFIKEIKENTYTVILCRDGHYQYEFYEVEVDEYTLKPNKELYYAIINICDYLALNPDIDEEFKRKLRLILPNLASLGDIDVSALFDANDCGGCKSWDEFIEALRELFKNGERG